MARWKYKPVSQTIGVRDVAPDQTYGRWRVLECMTVTSPSGRRVRKARCECASDIGGCGTVRVVACCALANGTSQSCGCLGLEKRSAVARSHGRTGTAEHFAWMSMRARCSQEDHDSYENYGGRGIYVCSGWNHSFQSFLDDMGPRPGKGFSIDRRNNDASYTCGHCDECTARGATANCRWTTADVQQRNKRTSKVLTHHGLSMVITDWADHLGVDRSILYQRLHHLGWTVEQALDTPVMSKGLSLQRRVDDGIAPPAVIGAARSLLTKQRNPNPRKPWKHIPAAE